MKTTYIKRERLLWWQKQSFYKVIEISEDATKTIELSFGDDILISESQNYDEQIGFIKNQLCSGHYSEIKREDFDKEYIKMVKQLNELASA